MGEPTPFPPVVDDFIRQARALRDDDRRVLAKARAAVDETFHLRAWCAANEIVAGRAHIYVEARQGIAPASVPDRLRELVRLGRRADPAEVAEWQAVARLTRAGMDDALLALVAGDSMRPPDLRQLYGPWKAMLWAAEGEGGPEEER